MKGTLLCDNALSPITACQDFFMVISMNDQCKWFPEYILKKCCVFLCVYIRYFNVIGSDAKGRLGEAPRPELRAHGRISGACFDAAMGHIPGLKVCNVKVQYTQHSTSISTII